MQPSPASLTRKLTPKEGYLEKRSRDGKRWDRRYFELERGQLHYYRGKGQKYGDTIRIYGSDSIYLSFEDLKVIVVETESRTWYFRAETAGQASEWLNALKLHIHGSAK